MALHMSPVSSVKCPDFGKGGKNNGTMEIKFSRPVPQSMFLEEPYMTGEAKLGCLDENGVKTPVSC